MVICYRIQESKKGKSKWRNTTVGNGKIRTKRDAQRVATFMGKSFKEFEYRVKPRKC